MIVNEADWYQGANTLSDQCMAMMYAVTISYVYIPSATVVEERIDLANCKWFFKCRGLEVYNRWTYVV